MLELTVRLVFSLAVVLGLLMLIARFGSRRFRGQSDAMVRVVHRQPLSRSNAVCVVAIGSRTLVLGTTEHQVRVLAELDPGELDPAALDPAALDPAAIDLAELETSAVLTALPSKVSSDPAEQPAVPRPLPGAHRAVVPVSPAADSGVLAGSVLSPATWRQALAVATRRAS